MMNKINPLYMLGLFSLVAVLMIYMNVSTQSDIITSAKANAHLESDAKYIAGLQSKWKNSKKSKQRIERILSHSSFKHNISSKNLSKGIYKIHLKNLNVHTLDSFVNKMLGESIEIKLLQIDRMSDKNASLIMECVL